MSKIGGKNSGDGKNTLYCSFCGKSQHEVRKLIAGPTVFICDECVELCMDIIREESKSSLVKAGDGVPSPGDSLTYEIALSNTGGGTATSVVLDDLIPQHTVLQAGWAAQVAAHIEASSAPAYFPLAFDQRGGMARWVAGWANLRSRVFALPYGDQGLLMPGAAYRRAGGYPDQPLMEDVHLVRALGRPLVQLEARAVTSAARYKQAGWLRRGARNLWTLTRYFAGADPQRLADRYRR